MYGRVLDGLTLPRRDRLAEENERSENDKVVIPAKVASQMSRVNPQSYEDEGKDREDRNNCEYLILPAFHHDVLS